MHAGVELDLALEGLLAKEANREILPLLVQVGGVPQATVRVRPAVHELEPVKVGGEEVEHQRALGE